jgi:hypothetical protein
METTKKKILVSRVSDLHGFNADQDPAFFLIEDPDQVPVVFF